MRNLSQPPWADIFKWKMKYSKHMPIEVALLPPISKYYFLYILGTTSDGVIGYSIIVTCIFTHSVVLLSFVRAPAFYYRVCMSRAFIVHSLKIDLLATSSLSFSLFGDVFISLSFLKGNQSQYRIWAWQFLFLSTWKMLCCFPRTLWSQRRNLLLLKLVFFYRYYAASLWLL